MVEENAILTACVGDVRAVSPVVEFVAEACVRLVELHCARGDDDVTDFVGWQNAPAVRRGSGDGGQGRIVVARGRDVRLVLRILNVKRPVRARQEAPLCCFGNGGGIGFAVNHLSGPFGRHYAVVAQRRFQHVPGIARCG